MLFQFIVMAEFFYFQVIFIVITVMVSGQGDVPKRCEYGEHCGFVPAPPGRTPSCAAPGLTYCEQLDHYPKDLIRELVDKKQFDLSSLLSDETRDDFGSNRNKGPYGYGPNSLRGTQHISLVNPQSHGQGGYSGPNGHLFPNSGYLPPSDNDPFLSRGQFQNQFFRGNSLPPPNGYVGYYTPSDQQRPPSQTYFPPFNSYLPSKVTNITLDNGWKQSSFRPSFPSPINLNPLDDFWRDNSYFEAPKTFGDSHRNNIGHSGDYVDNNGGRYYSMGRPQAGSYPASHGGYPLNHEKDYNSATTHSINHRHATQHSSITRHQDWTQRFPHKRKSDTQTEPNNRDDLKPRTLTKRDTDNTLRNIFKLLSDSREDDLHDGTNHTTLSRGKRQTPGTEQLCQTRSQYIMPRAALNKQGNWMYVVNMGDTSDGSSQLVKTEVCMTQECNGICSLPLGYTSRCEQRYVQKRLVALEQNGQRLYTDIFWFPSCCLCTISSNQT